jgi:NNP family nitrate/nitrite transporter-like MFS transporter
VSQHANNFDHDSGGSENTIGFQSQLAPILLLTAIFFINFISRITFAPLLPEIEKDLALSHSEAGSLFFLISVGYFITLISSGWLSSYLTHRRIIMLSVMFMGLALLLIALNSSLWGTRMGLFFLGLAAGLYLPSGIATLTQSISPQHWGKGIAVHELAPNLSFVVAPLLSEFVLVWFSWRAVPTVLGIAALGIGLSFIRFGRGGNFSGVAPSITAFKPFFVQPAFWIMVLLFGLGISSTLGIYAMLPLYLVTEHGMDRNLVNTLVALSRISGLVMAFAGGWATDRFGPKKALIWILLLSGLATIFMGVAPTAWVLLAVFLQPMLAGSFYPAGFAALSRISSPETRNLAVSLTVPIGFMIGGGAVPAGMGFMGDVASFSLGIELVGGLVVCGAGVACLLSFEKKTMRDPNDGSGG